MAMYQDFDLTLHNSFSFPAKCPVFIQPTTIQEINEIFTTISKPFYILGDGTNTLFTDDISPLIIKPSIKGIEVKESGNDVWLTAYCGENWHKLVEYCLERGFHGIENLALIPGSVGAAPVQNIGAYGVEIGSMVDKVQWFDFSTRQVKCLDRAECKFSYRDSIFKNELADQGIILSVTIKLSKLWSANLNYNGLDDLPANCTAKDVFEKVLTIRNSKLPDPSVTPNAGSFFKNPIISKVHYQTICSEYASVPGYVQRDNLIKIAAGWLIEQSGLKGFTLGKVGVHEKQALVLVNYGSTDGQDIIKLAKHVQNTVKEKFNIILEPEVRLLTQTGLMKLTQFK